MREEFREAKSSLTFHILFLHGMFVELFRLHCFYVWLIEVSTVERVGERAWKIQFRVWPRKNNAALSLSRKDPLVKSRLEYESRIFNSSRDRATRFHHVTAVGTKDHV